MEVKVWLVLHGCYEAMKRYYRIANLDGPGPLYKQEQIDVEAFCLAVGERPPDFLLNVYSSAIDDPTRELCQYSECFPAGAVTVWSWLEATGKAEGWRLQTCRG